MGNRQAQQPRKLLAPATKLLAPTARASLLGAALAAILALPLLGTAFSALHAAFDAAAWLALWADTQWLHAVAMTLWTGLAATAVSVALAALILSRSFPSSGPQGVALQAISRLLAPMLAVPHAAFAIGLAFLIAPSGWLLRAFSPWATGLDAPPPWPTTQDPWGLGLIAVLVAKEVPFLLWAALAHLQRADFALRLTRELQVAASMGYARSTAWWRVLWPQLWPRLTGPALAVLAYSLTVVDMALVIGPSSPPTLSVLAWQWLLDADAGINAQGAAAAWALALLVALVATAAWAVRRALQSVLGMHTLGLNGRRGRAAYGRDSTRGWTALHLLAALYLTVLVALAVGSVSGVWPFPSFWPHRLSLGAWQSVAASAYSITTTLALALASGLAALVWAMCWLEWAPPAWDAALRRWVYLPLALPSVLWVVGLHRLCLSLGMDAHWSGLWLAHTLAAVPYVLMTLAPAYTAFDTRFASTVASWGHSHGRFLLRVKWPLLKAALWSAFALGFAVSVAQYLPTLFIGAGRYATVTTEAVTLASGAQRSMTAAYAWLQWLLPALAFALAAWASRPRKFNTS